ncbi:recombinase family protein [Pilimelia columellifera]|uniref:Resolvase/invertase-type recombinase catalytic domain-containing protein n=1 Tax=Pilimelia columellifera subsp. columellifera TaxID=706583 RepID=A0ABP6AZ14_9ACTN
MGGVRSLAVTRLSRDTDVSSSIERQRADIVRWAAAFDHEVVAWAEDVDVSGGVSPFDRPELAPFLDEDGADSWDIVTCTRIDRLSRRVYHVVDVLRWCEE